MKVVYIAGPMRGIPNFNFPAFDKAKAELEGMGYRVISPADLDREAGIDGSDDLSGLLPERQDSLLRDCIRRDVLAIINECDGLYVMRGWENSRGCAVEIALAKFLGLEIVYER